ncbi:hypothetical protein GQ43DRAFT_92549 [Delitschia confertaspora ATCC 74209]|uniref:CENP-T/Histone H4 histone fold domain-containing protein n=1 Tax=Delitschia confertaspora ATCC 74209 TaxID=1513339 RepID=A0A9P4JYJ8_9PLEO|nr:hypothetical protein GQ43DRAFT_92549 [Delitschia confertaspora ATCC 74209]
MSDSPRKKQRITPRNSDVHESVNTETPYLNLRQLAGAIQNPITPFRRAISAGPTPGSRRTPSIPIRTPGTAARRSANRPIPARRAAPTTPHAIRALRERANAARTPGHNRRRSGRVQRETPRDILRDLSKVLARTTRPVQPSPLVPQPAPRNPALDDFEDGPDPVAPRLSLAISDMYYDDDDSFHEAPPRRSLLPDLPDDVDTGTIHSVELGRRALSEDPRRMFSTRVSERFADLNELGIDAASGFEVDGTFITRRAPLDAEQLLLENDEDLDETTTELQALTGGQGNHRSDIDLGVFGNDDEFDEPTFRFTIPHRTQAAARPGVIEEADEDADEYEDAESDARPQLDIAEGETIGAPELGGYESEGDAGEDLDLQAYREEASAIDRSLQTQSAEGPILNKEVRKQRKGLNISRHGLEYPSFPAVTVRRLATGFSRTQGSNGKINKDTMATIMQATEWFFEQVSDDLASYAQHAGRKMIEEDDVITLMKRQRQITENTTSFSLAQKMLPRELLQELRIPPTPKLKRTKRKRTEMMERGEEEAD